MKILIYRIIEKKIFFLSFLLILLIGITVNLVNDKAYLLLYLDKNRNDFLNHFFIAITKLGEYYPFVFFFFYFLYKKSRNAFSIAALGAFMPLISYYLKLYFKHPRPLTYFYKYMKHLPVEGIENMHYHTGHSSFPSGHTFAAFALFTLLTLMSKNKYLQILYFILAILVAISRVYLIQHFLEDVLFGGVIGVLLGSLVYYLFFDILKNKSFLDQQFKKF